MRVSGAVAVAVASVIFLAGCTNTEIPGPATTVTATATPSAIPRSPSDPITNFDAYALCAARTLEPSPFGEIPIDRIYNLDQVYPRDDGGWWVVIDQFDRNPNPQGHYNPDGATWAYCVLEGTIGEVEWRLFGGSIDEPTDDPNNIEHVDDNTGGD